MISPCSTKIEYKKSKRIVSEYFRKKMNLISKRPQTMLARLPKNRVPIKTSLNNTLRRKEDKNIPYLGYFERLQDHTYSGPRISK